MDYIKSYRHGVPIWRADPKTDEEFVEWLHRQVDYFTYDPNDITESEEEVDDSILKQFLF